MNDVAPSGSVVVRGWDEVGRAFAERLGEAFGLREVDPATTDPWEGLLIASFWRDRWQLAATLDDVAHEHHQPWIPVAFGPDEVACGPWVRPGHGVCWHCVMGSPLRNSGAGADGYDMTSETAPRGYLPLHLVMAREGLREVLRSPANVIVSLDFLQPALRRVGSTVGYPGCPRCSATPVAATPPPPFDLGEAMTGA